MKLWFIRSPVIISSSRSVSSRSRQPNSIIDTAPRSRPLVARNSKCDDIRLSSHSNMRIHCARGGMSPSMPSSVSVASENTSSLKSGEA